MPSVLKMLVEFDFVPEDHNDLMVDLLQPFIINGRNVEQCSAN